MPGVSPMSSRCRRSSPWPRTALMIAHCPAFRESSVGPSIRIMPASAGSPPASESPEDESSPDEPPSRSAPPSPESTLAASFFSCVMQTSPPALTFNCLSLRVTGASARTSSRTAEKYPCPTSCQAESSSPRELSSGKLLEHAAQLLLHAVLGVGTNDLARNLLDGRAPSRGDRRRATPRGGKPAGGLGGKRRMS